MTATTLICPECQRENEAERVYCHECGARLDRSVLPIKDGAKETRKRLKHIFDPGRIKLRLAFFKVSKLILGACALAVAVEMILPPENVPALVTSSLLPSQLRIDLENIVAYHRPPQIQFIEDQVNAYLVYALKPKQKTLTKLILEFNRAIAKFDEGACGITVERSIFGYPLYTSCTYAVQLRDGKIVVSPKSGGIGRMPIHPQLMQFVAIVFADVWSALDHERKLVSKFAAIEFHDKNVVLTMTLPQQETPAGPAPSPAEPASSPTEK
jgi:hypothetical protein